MEQKIDIQVLGTIFQNFCLHSQQPKQIDILWIWPLVLQATAKSSKQTHTEVIVASCCECNVDIWSTARLALPGNGSWLCSGVLLPRQNGAAHASSVLLQPGYHRDVDKGSYGCSRGAPYSTAMASCFDETLIKLSFPNSSDEGHYMFSVGFIA